MLAAGVPMLLATSADAGTRTFYPSKVQRGVATFPIKRLDPAVVESARLVSGVASMALRRADVRDAARRGVLRVRLAQVRSARLARAAAKGGSHVVVTTTNPPTVSITSEPPASTTATDASIGFTASGATSVSCQLDAGSWTTCATPATESGLSVGGHTFTVRASNKAGATSATASWTVVASPPPADPALLWSDEFNGPAGSPPDASSWTMQTGANYNGGDDHVAYTSDPGNVSMDGQGNLAITVRQQTVTMGGITRNYTSGRLNSAGKREFAGPVRIEASMKIPTEPRRGPRRAAQSRAAGRGTGHQTRGSAPAASAR